MFTKILILVLLGSTLVFSSSISKENVEEEKSWKAKIKDWLHNVEEILKDYYTQSKKSFEEALSELKQQGEKAVKIGKEKWVELKEKYQEVKEKAKEAIEKKKKEWKDRLEEWKNKGEEALEAGKEKFEKLKEKAKEAIKEEKAKWETKLKEWRQKAKEAIEAAKEKLNEKKE